jgi:hypothetical protein
MALDKDHVITAVISLILLGIIIAIIVSRLVAWRDLQVTRGDLKITFHHVLLGTCLLELPLWFLCVLPNVQVSQVSCCVDPAAIAHMRCETTQEDSFTNYPKHPFFPTAYACHVLALPGYFVCIGIIVVLWSDLLKSTQQFANNLATGTVRLERRHYFINLLTCRDSVRSFFAAFVMAYFAMEVAVAYPLYSLHCTHYTVLTTHCTHYTLYSLHTVLTTHCTHYTLYSL